MQYFHGFMSSAELCIRGWALILNFAPSNPHTVKKYGGLQSPAERLDGFSYHENWLHNSLSRDPPPVGSLRPFGLRHGRCPHHYNAAFAFSDILYPHSLRYTLRLPTSAYEEEYGLTMFRMI